MTYYYISIMTYYYIIIMTYYYIINMNCDVKQVSEIELQQPCIGLQH